MSSEGNTVLNVLFGTHPIFIRSETNFLLPIFKIDSSLALYFSSNTRVYLLILALLSNALLNLII